MKFIRILPILVMVMSVSACVDDSDDFGKYSNKGVKSTNLTAEVNANKVKTFNFQWGNVDGVDNYQLCRKDITKNGNCDKITEPTKNTSLEYTAPSLFDVQDQTYFLMSATDAGSVLSNELNLSSSDIYAARGYFRATEPKENDRFGNAVALSADGNIMAVAAPWAEHHLGFVSIYRKQNGSWKLMETLRGTENVDQQFGFSVAINANGTTLAVSTVNTLDENEVHLGKTNVYIYQRVESSWSKEATIRPSVEQKETLFGGSLALSYDGNTLIVGAPYYNEIVEGKDRATGAVYIFSKTNSQWTEQKKLLPSEHQEIEQNLWGEQMFGMSVAISGDGKRIAVGAEGDPVVHNDPGDGSIKECVPVSPNDKCGFKYGAVYVYQLEGLEWPKIGYLKANNHYTFTFGSLVSLNYSGSTLAIGAEAARDSDPDGQVVGAAYVFNYLNDESIWQQTAYLKNEDRSYSPEFFGHTVKLNGEGNLLAVGENKVGSVHVFKLHQDSWENTSILKPENIGEDTGFGEAIGMDEKGESLTIAAPKADLLTGTVYLY